MLSTFPGSNDFLCFMCMQEGPAALASAVLAEIPNQLTEYMKKKNIVPLQPQTPYP